MGRLALAHSICFVCLQRRHIVKQDDIVDALEEIQMEKATRGSSLQRFGETDLPPDVHKSIAVYEAGTALIGLITPNYDELQKVCYIRDV